MDLRHSKGCMWRFRWRRKTTDLESDAPIGCNRRERAICKRTRLSDPNVVRRQRLQRRQAPTGKILWPYNHGADFDHPAIRQHQRIWCGCLECFIRPLDEELPPKLSCPSPGITDHVAVVGSSGGNEKPQATPAPVVIRFMQSPLEKCGGKRRGRYERGWPSRWTIAAWPSSD
jgi:hypothetical protein